MVCLQEVWSDSGHDQARTLGDHLDYQVIRSVDDSGAAQPFGNAILSALPSRLAGQAALPSADGTSAHRSVLAAWVDVGWTEQLVVTTHLEWRYSYSALRQLQLEFVVDFVADLLAQHPLMPKADVGPRNPGPSAILTGDLNAVPESQEIRRLTGLEPPFRDDLIFTDAWAATNDEPGHTWTRDNPCSAEALWPKRRLDYVFVSWPRSKPWANPLSSRLAGIDTVDVNPDVDDDGDWSGPLAPSDHYAVVVDLDNRQTRGHA